MENIKYSTQLIDELDIESVVRILNSDYLTQGPIGFEFESSLAKYCGASYACSCSSATAGLHLAYMALGVGAGSRVWTSPITFAATANAALYCGASISLIDICSNDRNMSIESLEKKLATAQKLDSLPDVVVPVHFSGFPCDMVRIRELADIYNFKILEDASHALGADYFGAGSATNKVGGGQFSDATVFSFHPVKMITTGEGGVVLTNSQKMHEKMKRLRSHGITRDKAKFKNITFKQSEWYYEQHELGFNYRLSDINSALGLSQLGKLHTFVAARREIASFYLENIDRKQFKVPPRNSLIYSSWHLFVIELVTGGLDERDQFINYLKEHGIGANVHYIPLYRLPFHENLMDSSEFFNAEKYFKTCVSIPIHQKMKITDAQYIVDCCNNFGSNHAL